MEDAVRIFRLVATEFDVLNDETVEEWLNLTAPLISKKVFGKLYDQAIALLTAHRLKMAGYELDRTTLNALAPRAAVLMRKYIDNDDSWTYHRDYAISEAVSEYKEDKDNG